MKVKFSKEQKFVPEWNGNRQLPENEQMFVTIQALTLGDLILLMDGVSRAGITGAQLKSGEVTSTPMIGALKEINPVIVKYCKISGLDGDDGPITIEQVCDSVHFIPLYTEIMTAVVTLSQPDETETKN